VDPVLEKEMLELRDGGTFDPYVRFPPLLRVAGIAAPAIVDREPARKADPAVDHEDAAMGALADPVETIDPQRLVDGDLHTGAPHLLFERAERRAESVDEEPHLDTGARPFGQRPGESGSERSLTEDVELDVDALASRRDRLEKRRERAIPVLQQRGTVIGNHLGPERIQRSTELGTIHAIGRFIAVGRPLFRKNVRASRQSRQDRDGAEKGPATLPARPGRMPARARAHAEARK